jgi:hypothetical protein
MLKVMKRKLFLITCILGTSLVFTTGTFATKNKMTEDELSIYADNNILFYDPYGSCIGSAEGGVLSGEPDGTQIGFIKTYHDIAVMHSINYGIPWETVMAQGILESASGTSYFARERNNFFGIGAFATIYFANSFINISSRRTFVATCCSFIRGFPWRTI